MNGFQKLVKVLAICFAVFLIVNIVGGIIAGLSFFSYMGKDDRQERYEVSFEKSLGSNYVYKKDEVKRIDIDIAYAELYITKVNNPDVTVEISDELERYLTVNIQNGRLKITEDDRWFGHHGGFHHRDVGIIRVYIPSEINLEELEIDSGARKC